LHTRHAITDLDQPFFVTLEKCDINISVAETKQLLLKLPAAAQPQFLSASVTEILDPNHEVVQCKQVQCLNAKLQSEQFKEAIVRIALHSLKKDVEEQDIDLVNNAAERLKMITIVGVKELKTWLTFKGERVEKRWPSLYKVHENRSDATKCKIYFCVQKQKQWDTFLIKLSNIICDVMSDCPQLPSSFIVPVLRCAFNTEHEELDLLEIKQNIRKPANDETYLPVAGTFVPIIHHHLLRRDIPLMKPGEYAALEKYDPAENDEPGEPTYVIVQIIEQKDTTAALYDAKYVVDIGEGQSAVVSAASLYTFARQVTCTVSSDGGSDDAEFEKNTPVDYDTVINDLKVTLTDAWKMDKADRNKILKRLILHWHPDNNTGISDLANRVTQFILFAADRLDNGLPLNDNNAGAASSSQLTSTHVPSTTDSSSSNLCQNYYQYMTQRAREHHRQQKEYERNYEQNTSHVVKRRKQHFFQTFYTGVNPQPGEGRRWLRQAEMDVQAAKNDESSASESYEWACYKYYQV